MNQKEKTINKKELLVEGYFDNGYIVRRGLKPNIFETSNYTRLKEYK